MTSNLFRAVMITFVLLVFCFSLFSYILVTNNYERAESYKNISEQSLKLNKELLDKWVGCEAIRMNVTKDYLLETITEVRK